MEIIQLVKYLLKNLNALNKIKKAEINNELFAPRQKKINNIFNGLLNTIFTENNINNNSNNNNNNNNK